MYKKYKMCFPANHAYAYFKSGLPQHSLHRLENIAAVGYTWKIVQDDYFWEVISLLLWEHKIRVGQNISLRMYEFLYSACTAFSDRNTDSSALSDKHHSTERFSTISSATLVFQK